MNLNAKKIIEWFTIGFLALGFCFGYINRIVELSDIFYFFVCYFFIKNIIYINEIKNNMFFLIFISLITITKLFVFDVYKTPTSSMTPTIPTSVGENSGQSSFLVNKMAFGLNVPFYKEMNIIWDKPKRQDIVLFYYEQTDDKGNKIKIPYLKRVIGIEGDIVYYDFINKEIYLTQNEKEKEHFIKTKNIKNEKIKKITPSDKILYIEKSKYGEHYIYNDKKDNYTKVDEDHILIYGNKIPNIKKYIVGKDEVFVLGDNRDGSFDSRFIGNVKINTLIGKMERFIFQPDYLK